MLQMDISFVIFLSVDGEWGDEREKAVERLQIIYVRLSRLSKCGDEGNNKVKL